MIHRRSDCSDLTIKEYNREYHQRNRLVVLIHYSGYPPKCQCCGEEIIAFLGIDHIDGRPPQGTPGGNKGKIRGGAMYEQIIKDGFPSGLRVLCHNCNMAIGFYGRCPHEEIRDLDKKLEEMKGWIRFKQSQSSSMIESEKTTETSTSSATVSEP